MSACESSKLPGLGKCQIMINVSVFTGTRAEYGLLYWLLKDLKDADDFNLKLLVSGSHLSPEFGFTVNQIKEDGFDIADQVEMLLSSNTPVGTVKSLGLGVIGYAEALDRQQPDLLIVLGDRYEALGVAQVAMLMRIPILHIHGGEVTEGAYDDSIRHAISKLSLLHATSTETHRKRVIQLGESPDRVFNVGAIGLDHLFRSRFMSRDELEKSLDFQLGEEFAVLTYHSATIADEPSLQVFKNILSVLDEFSNLKVIVTYPNADDGGRELIPIIEDYAQANKQKVLAIASMGQKRYLSALKYATFVIGNSSSGIIEVPSFNIPTVNVGMRQYGREAASSVVHSQTSQSEIESSVVRALEMNKSMKLAVVKNPYGGGNASQQILSIIRESDLKTKKSFYDLPFIKESD